MIVRALDSNGDWVFGTGRNAYKSQANATQQQIQSNCLSFLGDCFFDLLQGIDWFRLLGAKDQNRIVLAISTQIMGTANVTRILSLDAKLDRKTRGLTVNYKVLTTFSTLTGSFQQTLGV